MTGIDCWLCIGEFATIDHQDLERKFATITIHYGPGKEKQNTVASYSSNTSFVQFVILQPVEVRTLQTVICRMGRGGMGVGGARVEDEHLPRGIHGCCNQIHCLVSSRTVLELKGNSCCHFSHCCHLLLLMSILVVICKLLTFCLIGLRFMPPP